LAIARGFGGGGYAVTLVARNADGLNELAENLAGTGAEIDTITADASDPEDLRDRMSALYRRHVHQGSSFTTRSSELRTNC
jgi:short-subunit dehydrogenase